MQLFPIHTILTEKTMVAIKSLIESVGKAKSNEEAQELFKIANSQMPDNAAGHSVPVYFMDLDTGDMMVLYPDGRVEKTGKSYPEAIDQTSKKWWSGASVLPFHVAVGNVRMNFLEKVI